MKIDDMVAVAREGAVKPAMLPNPETGVLEPSYIVILDKDELKNDLDTQTGRLVSAS